MLVWVKSRPKYAIFNRGGYGLFRIPALKGCVTYGESIEEAQKMAKDAIEGYVASLKKHNEEIPEEQNVLLTSVFANA